MVKSSTFKINTTKYIHNFSYAKILTENAICKVSKTIMNVYCILHWNFSITKTTYIFCCIYFKNTVSNNPPFFYIPYPSRLVTFNIISPEF